jgi:inhibitor of cysteine peptidase
VQFTSRHIQQAIDVRERIGGTFLHLLRDRRVAMAEIVITEADRGREVVARVSDALVVQLPENPTTGFRWALASPDSNILELAQDEFQTAAQAGVGGGGLRVLRFAARSAGSIRLELKLARSWESGTPKVVFSVDVKVS